MGVDLAVATPAFLDLTFVGLEALPALGEERFAADLVRSPGGGGIIATAGARLGLDTALAAPLGDDAAGELVRSMLEAEGVRLVDRRAPMTPTTVVLPVAGDRAMATVDPGVRASAADVAALDPRAVAASLDQLYCVPRGVWAFATCGEDDARAFARRPPGSLAAVRALFVNEREAATLTGVADPAAAAEALARDAAAVVVSRGAAGALAIVDGERIEARGFDTGAPVDTTGAGDLLATAYAWADLRGLPAADRVRWAVLYAALSITTPTAVGGAATVDRLLAAGAQHGLAPPERRVG